MSQSAEEADRGPAFVFTGGSAPLDLVATLGRRRSAAPIERLPDPPALARWLIGSGQARTLTEPTDADLELALRLREAVYDLLRPLLDPPATGDADEAVAVVNEIGARPALGDRLVATAEGLRAEPAPGTVSEALARIARQATTLLGGPDAQRVKECEHPDCSLLFLDETQGRRRRWCSMERCGNLVKISGYRARRKRQPTSR
ncbi:CGNR zinc finger domain-containing protein [Pseudonocardia spinosispora]|uniref:CGNR zinc finger domain-containing protein n=1 Tax=Pseudonocardia spinosispora TaxID=103441 RepID=UPI0003F7E24B|nr:ABATE domain-containing protein [Pseudonocardia spinosispora]